MYNQIKNSNQYSTTLKCTRGFNITEKTHLLNVFYSSPSERLQQNEARVALSTYKPVGVVDENLDNEIFESQEFMKDCRDVDKFLLGMLKACKKQGYVAKSNDLNIFDCIEGKKQTGINNSQINSNHLVYLAPKEKSIRVLFYDPESEPGYIDLELTDTLNEKEQKDLKLFLSDILLDPKILTYEKDHNSQDPDDFSSQSYSLERSSRNIGLKDLLDVNDQYDNCSDNDTRLIIPSQSNVNQPTCIKECLEFIVMNLTSRVKFDEKKLKHKGLSI